MPQPQSRIEDVSEIHVVYAGVQCTYQKCICQVLCFEPEATEVLKAKQVGKLGKLRLETLGSVATLCVADACPQ